MADARPLLEIEDLRTHFYTSDGVVRAVDGVSYSVRAGETLAVVGESGCGKSVTAMSILRLLPSPPARIVSGAIRFEGRDLLGCSEAEMRRIRGNDISMIFQEPMTSLNPVLTVGRQIAETLQLHQGLSRAAAGQRAVEMLDLVRMPEPARRAGAYPHQLSGGMRQRVMIAMALSCDPKLLIADEPTTALDVTIQAQILDLMRDIVETSGAAIVLVTHDLGIAASLCHRVNVMYAGQIVESAPVDGIFSAPMMPYTWGLLDSIPRTDRPAGADLPMIPGIPPDPLAFGAGCRFAPRCAHARDVCRTRMPALAPRELAHLARCLGTEADGWLEVEA